MKMLKEIMQKKAEADIEAWREKMYASHKEMAAEIKPETDMKKMVCRETTEARLEEKEPTSLDRKPEVAERREVPVGHSTVMPVGERKKKRRKDRKLTPERRRHKKDTRKQTMACQTTEARLEDKQPTSVDKKPGVVQQYKAPKEDVVLK
jgi:hypothetical protein